MQPHPLLDWLGGPLGIALGWAILALLQAVTGYIVYRTHERQKSVVEKLDGGLDARFYAAASNAIADQQDKVKPEG